MMTKCLPSLPSLERIVAGFAESHYTKLVGHDDVIDKLIKPQSHCGIPEHLLKIYV